MALSATHRSLLKARTSSPGQYLLSPNDDASERARARAERAAAQRRKFLPADSATESPQEDSNLLDEEVVAGLLESCLKLAAENKINQQNTWELPLIDHLSEVFKNNDNQDAQCNFQKASCGLEAGVKIYATRVDSVHSQAFRVLGGISRSSNPENAADEETAGDVEESVQTRKESSHKKGDSTLAPSFESLTLKKFDLAFSVDPLFHLTSAQFDEGGARGLLLNTLSVYRHCELAFDSLEVPERRMKAETLPESAGAAIVDLSFMTDTINQMIRGISEYPVLTPTLEEILRGLDDPARAAAEAEASRETIVSGTTWAPDPDSCFNDDTCTDLQNSGYPDIVHQAGYDMNDDMVDSLSVEDDNIPSLSPISGSVNEDDGGSVYDGDVDSAAGQDEDETFGWLVGQKGQDPKSNAWAGSEHWKFRKADEASKTEADSKDTRKESKSKKQPEQFVVDFEQNCDAHRSRFVVPKDPTVTTKRYNLRASTLAQRRRADSLHLLPEDCHYQARDLVQLFLRPVVRTQRKGRRRHGALCKDYSRVSTVGEIWDEVESFGAGDDDEWRHDSNDQSDVEDPSAFELVPEPRKVQKVSVNYERTSKQVDVHRLKETMWEHLSKEPVAQEDSHQEAKGCTSSSSSIWERSERCGVSFQKMLECLSEETPDTLSNASVALCLICLLHLANDHGLVIVHSPSLDEVIIQR